MSEYWILRKGAAYWSQEFGWTKDRPMAARWRTAALARQYRSGLTDKRQIRIRHVRIRPRSERLYLCERLKAWEATVREAQCHVNANNSPDGVTVVCGCRICRAVRAIPKEHRL